MRENRTSGSEGGEAQTNELSLPLSFCLLCDMPRVGGPSVVRSDRRAEAAPTLRRPVAERKLAVRLLGLGIRFLR